MFISLLLFFIVFNWFLIWVVFIEFISVWVCVWCVFIQVDFVCVWICVFSLIRFMCFICVHFLSLSFTVSANKVKVLALCVVLGFIILCCFGCFTVDWVCFIVVYDGVVGPLLFIAITVNVSNRWIVGLWVWIFYGALNQLAL